MNLSIIALLEKGESRNTVRKYNLVDNEKLARFCLNRPGLSLAAWKQWHHIFILTVFVFSLVIFILLYRVVNFNIFVMRWFKNGPSFLIAVILPHRSTAVLPGPCNSSWFLHMWCAVLSDLPLFWSLSVLPTYFPLMVEIHKSIFMPEGLNFCFLSDLFAWLV